MKRLALTLALTLALGACVQEAAAPSGPPNFESSLCGRRVGPEAGEYVGEYELGCTGLISRDGTAVLGSAESLVLAITGDGMPITGAEAGPCKLVMQHPLVTPQQTLGIRLEDLNEPGHASIFTYYRGKTWTASDGCLQLDEYERNRGVGRYEGIFEEKEGATGFTGRYARFFGEVDWCEYGARSDCPHNFYDASAMSTLGAITIEGPIVSGAGKVTECRALIDRSTEAVQVDLEMAVFKDQPVSQIYAAACGGGVGFLIVKNSFVFRAGGVSGPGSYGPLPSRQFSEHRLPGFELRFPTRWFASNDTQACAVETRGSQILGQTTATSTCTYSISESPGRFELECSNTAFHGTVPGVIFQPEEIYEGTFKLGVDCAVRYR